MEYNIRVNVFVENVRFQISTINNFDASLKILNICICMTMRIKPKTNNIQIDFTQKWFVHRVPRAKIIRINKKIWCDHIEFVFEKRDENLIPRKNDLIKLNFNHSKSNFFQTKFYSIMINLSLKWNHSFQSDFFFFLKNSIQIHSSMLSFNWFSSSVRLKFSKPINK